MCGHGADKASGAATSSSLGKRADPQKVLAGKIRVIYLLVARRILPLGVLAGARKHSVESEQGLVMACANLGGLVRGSNVWILLTRVSPTKRQALVLKRSLFIAKRWDCFDICLVTRHHKAVLLEAANRAKVPHAPNFQHTFLASVCLP